jgi:hypothetical protein
MAGKKKSSPVSQEEHIRGCCVAYPPSSTTAAGVASAMDGVAVYGVSPPSAIVISGRTSAHLEEARSTL